MKTETNYIDLIITEAALDPRVDSGIVDLNNPIHVRVVAEAIYDYSGDEVLVNEFVKKFVEEGKYPDRQAFNREGWLVTFPSKEYRDRAIKKGTHSVSDPTHGKGGMNLYYKKKGKQKRQKQQDVTATEEPVDSGQPSSPGQQKTQTPQQPISTQPPKKVQPPKPQNADDETAGMSPEEAEEFNRAVGSADPDETPDADSGSSLPPAGEETPVDPASGATPAPDKPEQPAATQSAPAAPTAPAEPPYAALSEKFAKQKGWTPTPYKSWRDQSGETAAVVGLTGEVVPIKTIYREEFELFVSKNVGS